MPDEVRLWQIGPDEHLSEIRQAPLNLEARLQEWLARDISILCISSVSYRVNTSACSLHSSIFSNEATCF